MKTLVFILLLGISMLGVSQTDTLQPKKTTLYFQAAIGSILNETKGVATTAGFGLKTKRLNMQANLEAIYYDYVNIKAINYKGFEAKMHNINLLFGPYFKTNKITLTTQIGAFVSYGYIKSEYFFNDLAPPCSYCLGKTDNYILKSYIKRFTYGTNGILAIDYELNNKIDMGILYQVKYFDLKFNPSKYGVFENTHSYYYNSHIYYKKDSFLHIIQLFVNFSL